MKKISSINILSILVILIVSPYVAVSRVWKDYLLIVIGLTILILSILLRRELNKVVRMIHGAEDLKSDTYVENNPK